MYDTSPPPPVEVRKRDGRVVPFEADKISRSLFAAGESLGRPDPFLARELTDGVVHFLAAEGDESTPPSTAQVAELVVKVVRELGQPALAEAFDAHGRHRMRMTPKPTGQADRELLLRFPDGATPASVLAEAARQFSLRHVFARDLAAAHADGLLVLTGLDHPGELEGCVIGPPPHLVGSEGLSDAVEVAGRVAGRFVVLDGPEHSPVITDDAGARAFATELNIGLRVSGLNAIVNLNAAAAPQWAGELARGPLFAEPAVGGSGQQRADAADALLAEILRGSGGRALVDWHLAAPDFAAPGRARLEHVAGAALAGAAVAFTFDRPKRPVALAEGIDRANPAVLLTVGLALPRLAERTGVKGNAALFLRKVASLARLALSAATQKRAFLRKLERTRAAGAPDGPAVSAGFLLDRARLIVAPVGLDGVARAFTGKGLADGGDALELGKEVVAGILDVLRHDGRQSLLQACLDGPSSFALEGAGTGLPEVAGLTPWGAAGMRDQARAAGSLHELCGCGTLALFVPEDRPPAAAEAVEWLRLAWQRSDVVRLRIVRGAGV